MAVMSSMPETPPQVNPKNKLRDIGVPGITASRREIVSEPSPSMVNDTVYVAVAKDVKDSKLNLIWAIQNSGGRRICILHVHVPAPMIPLSKFVTCMCTCNCLWVFDNLNLFSFSNVLHRLNLSNLE